eukprot:jgi/Mesen1/3809/ME000206S02989
MFPSLLEDAEVSELFAHVLEFTARERDLTLANGERYPGVYWLLLHKSKAVRQMAKKLCVQQGKIRCRPATCRLWHLQPPLTADFSPSRSLDSETGPSLTQMHTRRGLQLARPACHRPWNSKSQRPAFCMP